MALEKPFRIQWLNDVVTLVYQPGLEFGVLFLVWTMIWYSQSPRRFVMGWDLRSHVIIYFVVLIDSPPTKIQSPPKLYFGTSQPTSCATTQLKTVGSFNQLYLGAPRVLVFDYLLYITPTFCRSRVRKIAQFSSEPLCNIKSVTDSTWAPHNNPEI